MIKIFDHTPSLTELEISTNEISGQSLKELSEIFKFSLRNLENLNFSNNWIDLILQIQKEGFNLWLLERGFSDPNTSRTLQMDLVFFR